MEFRIADTFISSLDRLTGDEQKAVKTTAFDLQLNPAHPGLSFHKLYQAKDKNFWSVRVNLDLRLIVHRTSTSLLLCYVGHHDPAYRWAERRKLERHPRTGAAQIVEIRETVREIEIPRYVEPANPKPPAVNTERIFVDVPEDQLLAYGVPVEWLDDVREATEESLLDLADHLPAEAAEALLERATGGRPEPSIQIAGDRDPFSHPDAQRRFRVMTDIDALRQALEYPWERWTVFLHPAQRAMVERRYSGPARVAGSAGTGKTVVALHRAVHLAHSRPEANVLLTTFDAPLARALEIKLERLIGHKKAVRSRISVEAIDDVAIRVVEAVRGSVKVADADTIRSLLREASTVQEHSFSERFLEIEWHEVFDAWGLETWDSYRDVQRLGRKTRLGERQRQALWAIFEEVKKSLFDRELLTSSGLFVEAVRLLEAKASASPFEIAVVDEAQDIGVAALRFLAMLTRGVPDGLFFAGDLGQRIFRTPFSWRALGVDVRGRSHSLRINYRTSHQIRRQAERLLPSNMTDVDGNREERQSTVSVFNGPEPEVCLLESREAEAEAVAEWLRTRFQEGIAPSEIGVFVRASTEIDRARMSINKAELPSVELDGLPNLDSGAVAIGTMHRAKGLEFRAIAVMACDDEVIPSQERIESVADESDLEDVYETERHLLYVACTRARDHLLVTGVTPGSEFLEDLRPVLVPTD